MKLLEPLQLLFIMLSLGSSWIIFPDDIVTAMNAIYSKLPPIRLGIDNTKVGFGFRMGRNADVQVLYELGPQAPTTRSPNAPKRDVPHWTKGFDLKRFFKGKRAPFNLINRFWRRRPAITAPTTAPTTMATTTTKSTTPVVPIEVITEEDIKENEIE